SPARPAPPSPGLAAPGGLLHPDLLRRGALLPAPEWRPDRRDARGHRRDRAGRGGARDPADEPLARRRSRGLHDRPPDGLSKGLGPPLLPGPGTAPAGAAAWPRTRLAPGCQRAGPRAWRRRP